MNANTACKIDDAIAQAIHCGEAETEIRSQVERSIKRALTAKYETAIVVAQHKLTQLTATERI